MPLSSSHSTDTEPDSIRSNQQNLTTSLSTSPTNALLLTSISESGDNDTTPTLKMQTRPNLLELDSDDEDDEDELELNQIHHSSHYKQFGDMENEEIVQDGYLEKKGERRKRWQRRWFVLRRTSLVYYKNEKEYRLLTMIPLTDIHTCAEVQVKHHDYTFGIVTPNRTYYVRAKTGAERDKWTTKVTEAKDALKKGVRKHSGDDLPIGPSGNGAIIRSHTVIGNELGDELTNRTRAARIREPHLVSILSSTTLTQPPSEVKRLPPPPPTNIYSPDPSTTSECISSASELAQHRKKTSTSKNVRSPLLSDMVEPSETFSPPNHHRRYDLSSGGSSNGHELNYLSSGYSQATNTHGMLSSSEEENDPDDEHLASTSMVKPVPIPMSTGFGVGPELESGSPLAGERKLSLPEAGKTIIQGYLMKQGKRKTWRKRYFILTSQNLACSRTHMNKTGRGTKQISVGRILDAIECDSTIVTGPRHLINSPNGHHHPLTLSSNNPIEPNQHHTASSNTEERIEHCFKIITSDRTYLLNAPTEEDEIRWISAIRCLLATYRTNHPKQFDEILNQPIIDPNETQKRSQSVSHHPPLTQSLPSRGIITSTGVVGQESHHTVTSIPSKVVDPSHTISSSAAGGGSGAIS